MTINTVGDIFATIAFVNLALFVALYATFAPWWRSPYGRSVMALTAVLAAVFGLVVASLWFGVQWPARELIRAIIFGAVAVSTGQLLRAHLALKLSAWREARRERKNPEGN